jgi:hypothetical protein
MDLYEIWVDLAPGEKDRELVTAIQGWLDYHIANNTIERYRISRRKFGFGFAPLGEFHITIECKSLAQLDEAFSLAATRAGEAERLHVEVYRRVTNYHSALYRDYPDPEDRRE